MTESLSLKTSEHHRNVGSFPSTPNCSLGRTEKSCRPRTAWADVGTSAAQTAPACFLISSQRGLTASKQALPIKQWMTVWLRASPSLSSTLKLATRKWFLSSFPLPSPFLIRPLPLLSAYFLLFCQNRFNSACTCWLSSSPSVPNLNVNVTAAT